MTKLEELLMLLLHLMTELGGLIVTSGEFLNVSCSWFDDVSVYISKTMLTDTCGYAGSTKPWTQTKWRVSCMLLHFFNFF